MQNKVLLATELAKRSLVDSIYCSAGVEGLSVTFPDTMCILDNVAVNAKPDDVMFILNMRDAWKFLISNVDYNNNLMFIRELNKICGNKLIYGSGDLRTVDVRIGGCSYKPPIPEYGNVTDMLRKIDTVENGIEKALVMFCYLAKSQLFIDGNKRVAQLMANKILISNGIGILQIPHKLRNQFAIALVLYYETGDASDLCLFLSRECIQKV